LEVGNQPKLADLISRINGRVVQIPGLSHDDRRADKVVLALALLRKRFGKHLKVPPGLLRFIDAARFRYDARSIRHFVDQLPSYLDELRDDVYRQMGLHEKELLVAKGNSLAYHLVHENGAAA